MRRRGAWGGEEGEPERKVGGDLTKKGWEARFPRGQKPGKTISQCAQYFAIEKSLDPGGKRGEKREVQTPCHLPHPRPCQSPV